MDETAIIEFRNKAVRYFESVLTENGYGGGSSDLAFLIAKVLEDTLALFEDIETANRDTEEVIQHVHMLYANKHAFNEGNRILMWEEKI